MLKLMAFGAIALNVDSDIFAEERWTRFKIPEDYSLRSGFNPLLNSPEKERESLEKLLSSTSASETSTGLCHIYTLKALLKVNDRASLNINPIALGSAHILNQDGYFLTNNHVFDLFFKGKNEHLLLLYDPRTGLTAPVYILARDSERDIALGKVDINPSLKEMYNSVNILTSEPEVDAEVYSEVLKNPEYIMDKGFDNLLDSISIGMSRTGKVMFRQKSSVKEDPDIQYLEIKGVVMDDQEYKEVIQKKKINVRLAIGNHVFAEITNLDSQKLIANVIKSNSGSPVYIGQGLCGIIRAVHMTKLELELADGKKAYAIPYEFIGPAKIRQFLKDYLEVCRR